MMNKCGKKREAISRWRAMSVSSSSRPSVGGESLTAIVFKGIGACLIAGAESQQVYCFSSHDPEQLVDAKDADALLKTGLFRALS